MIRRAREEEWERLRDLRLRALADASGAFWETYDEALALPEEEWRRRARGVTFVDDEWRGMAAGIPDGDAIRVVAVWVDPSARRAGLGAALTAAVVDWARDETAAPACVLGVAGGNDGARRVYRGLGFVETDADAPPGCETEMRLALDRGERLAP